ncbi:5-formyltetrahydrofolate cyclo-ligase [Rubritalea spongiae]|uniref:5-formyltetrahydrofolate cyclo-ligase n=1 Tax=Rubritalea spongiae TaxID=430797 RepID=A0ABW5DXT5_9BACT
MDSELKLKKNALRQQMREKLLQLSHSEKIKQSQTINKKIVQYTEDNPQLTTVASFAALPTEPNLQSLHSQNLALVYPLSHQDGLMQFYRVDETSSLVKGRFAIPEPNPSIHPAVAIEQIDLFLVPAFAYTPDGKRLGKGGGYYDRLLVNRSPQSKLIGVCFSCQVLKTLPTEPHDISVDHLISGS